MMFYVNPYNPSAKGFYFESIEELEVKAKTLVDDFGIPVEEFEIDFIEGTKEECALSEALGLDAANIAEFIEFIETSDEAEWPTVYFLLTNSRCETLDEARAEAEEFTVREGTLKDASAELFDELYNLPEEVRIYIDYEKFARDCEQGGDMVEFEFAGRTYTCTNANQ